MSDIRTNIPLYGDPGFSPIELFFASYEADVRADKEAKPLWLALEREDELISVWKTAVLSGDDPRTYPYIERTVKCLLWLKGGYRLFVAGSPAISARLSADYKAGGLRAFDAAMMERVYAAAMEIIDISFDAFPRENEQAVQIGGKWEGCRIGFDAGGSDRKVAAVKDGEVIFSEEVVWYPKTKTDPDYHLNEITDAFRKAESYLPKVDCIGVSSAGIYVANRTRVASLFIKVADEDFKRVAETIYIDAAKRIGVSNVAVANDGDVAALAGAYEVGGGRLLGIAMGTSEAAGYVNGEKHVTGWLNELAFVPVDMSPEAMVDEWSGDKGCGVKYFSQDGVIKLANAVGIHFPEEMPPGARLKVVQEALTDDPAKIGPIFETIGVYLAYAVKFYARFYDLQYVMLMGRVMSGRGGEILLAAAKRTLAECFPELGVSLILPDEKSRRLGQAAAAASLPS